MKSVLLSLLTLIFIFEVKSQTHLSCWGSPRFPNNAFLVKPPTQKLMVYRTIHLKKMSCIEVNRLPKSYHSINSTSHKIMPLDYRMITSPYCKNEPSRIILNDYQLLKMQYDPNFVCRIFLDPFSSWFSSYSINTIHTVQPVLIESTDQASIPQRIRFTSDINRHYIVSKRVCNAVVRTITKDPDCIKMLGMLGPEQCDSYVTFELLNSKDREEFGEYFTQTVDESHNCFTSKTAVVTITKYTDGHVVFTLMESTFSR